jgi:hypothetical protein
MMVAAGCGLGWCSRPAGCWVHATRQAGAAALQEHAAAELSCWSDPAGLALVVFSTCSCCCEALCCEKTWQLFWVSLPGSQWRRMHALPACSLAAPTKLAAQCTYITCCIRSYLGIVVAPADKSPCVRCHGASRLPWCMHMHSHPGQPRRLAMALNH